MDTYPGIEEHRPGVWTVRCTRCGRRLMSHLTGPYAPVPFASPAVAGHAAVRRGWRVLHDGVLCGRCVEAAVCESVGHLPGRVPRPGVVQWRMCARCREPFPEQPVDWDAELVRLLDGAA